MFNFHVSEFPKASELLVFNFIPLWFQKLCCMTSVVSSLLRFLVWPALWSVPESGPWVPEHSVYSYGDGAGGVFCACPLGELVSAAAPVFSFLWIFCLVTPPVPKAEC